MFLRLGSFVWLTFSFESGTCGLCNRSISSMWFKLAIWHRFFNSRTRVDIFINSIIIFANINSARPYNFLLHLFYLLQKRKYFLGEAFLHSGLTWISTVMVSSIILIFRIVCNSQVIISSVNSLKFICIMANYSWVRLKPAIPTGILISYNWVLPWNSWSPRFSIPWYIQVNLQDIISPKRKVLYIFSFESI